LLARFQWEFVAKIGSGAFEMITGEVVNVALLTLSAVRPEEAHDIVGLDVTSIQSPAEKAAGLASAETVHGRQYDQLRNPDARLALGDVETTARLNSVANAWQGIASSDSYRFGRCFWELPSLLQGWRYQQSTVKRTMLFGGREHILFWQDGHGAMTEVCQEGATFRGMSAWRKPGIAVAQMGSLAVTLSSGELFDNNTSIITPFNPKDLPAIWAFCSSDAFRLAVRKLDQKMNVTNSTFGKVSFDRERWGRIAAEEYPNALPKPFSSDPTQWLFNGHPRGADESLLVALARLLGYQWPRHTGSSFLDCPMLGPDGLEAFADSDGIVSLTSLKGEEAAAERLRKLLAVAYGREWSVAKQPELLAKVGFAGKSLEDWLRDGFFEQHCVLFHQRPFVWHLWDGERDGFHALINYHKLAAQGAAGRKTLEKLNYSYLGDWINRQRAEQKQGKEGADAKLASALHLQEQLKMIIEGEPPYDLFVRWKPLHEQAIGWEPDTNDGVRLNIRPFMMARTRSGKSIFRKAPKIKWEKDRGKEPERSKQDFPWFWGWDQKTEDFTGGRQFDGNRWNDLHYSNEMKREARARHKGSRR
jgi:hypothetical protein